MSPQASDQNGNSEIQSNQKPAEFRFATYNVQSVSSSMKIDALKKKFQTYKLDVMGNQETHLKDTSQKTLPKRVFYSIGKPTTVPGMGFLSKHEGTLKIVNDKVITREILHKNKKYESINCYAPLCSAVRRTLQQGKVSMMPSITLCSKN